jgi:tRNA(fMet)-specific endonuclease VapC
MLDTNVLITAMRRKGSAVAEKLGRVAAGNVCISAVAYGELMLGVYKTDNPKRSSLQVKLILNEVAILPVTLQVAEVYGVLKAHLEKRGESIGRNDLWIAAHAVAEEIILVTNNEREFRRVPGLRIENWTKE